MATGKRKITDIVKINPDFTDIQMRDNDTQDVKRGA